MGQNGDLFYQLIYSPKQSANDENRYRGSDLIRLGLGKDFSQEALIRYGPELNVELQGGGRKEDASDSSNYFDIEAIRIITLRFFLERQLDKFRMGFLSYEAMDPLRIRYSNGDSEHYSGFNSLSGAAYFRIDLNDQFQFLLSYQMILSQLIKELRLKAVTLQSQARLNTAPNLTWG